MSKTGRMYRFGRRLVSVALGAMILMMGSPSALATNAYSSQSLGLSTSVASATSVTYTLTLSGVTTSTVKCLKIVFGTTLGGSTEPTGMSTASAALGGSSNYIPTPASWTADGATADGTVKITYAAGETPASASSRTIILTGITNSSSTGTYYAELTSYNNTDCATSPVDGGGSGGGDMLFVISSAVSVNGTVNPSLTYTLGDSSACAALGTLATGATTSCSHTIAVATNAASGYTVSYGAGSTTLTNQRPGHTSETIAGIGSGAATSATGTAQFGINLASNATPSVGAAASGGSGTATSPYGTADNFAFEAGTAHQVASYNGPSATTTYTVSYIVNISGTTKPGSYIGSLVYNIVANY